MPTLASEAFVRFTRDFQERNLRMSEDQEQAIRSFFEVLEKGLLGKLSLSFYLLALDPGMGKTTAILAFLKAWRSVNFEPASSVLVGLSTLQELTEFVEKSGLKADEFGVLTSDLEMNGLGLPSQRHGDARVLFTSQAMIRSRTRGKTFGDASEFHFAGKPRALRIWDEDILPRQWRTIRVDDIRSLASPLRPVAADYVDQMRVFADTLIHLTPGSLVTVPEEAALPPSLLPQALQAASDLRNTLEALQEMAGQQVRVESGTYYGMELLGLTEPLPSDLAPLVVVDASGRVRDAYRVWEAERGDLIRLPSAGNLYLGVNLHHWHRASGRDTLADPAQLNEIASGIAQAFGRDPEGHWLIIAPKATLEGLKLALDAQDHPLAEAQINWLNWGRHRSTNDFKDVENVIIVGLHRYRPTDYQALALAASGQPLGSNDYPNPSSLRIGELKHNLLQAACRGSLRRADKGVAARANVFVVGIIDGAESFFDQVFPGCNYVAWNEPVTTDSMRVEAAIQWVCEKRAGDPRSEIRKQDLRFALGMTPQNFTRLLQSESFAAFLDREGLEVAHRSIRRSSYSFASKSIDDDVGHQGIG